MKISASIFAFGLVLATGLAAPGMAQSNSGTITAKQPSGIVNALINAGYEANLETDNLGDPLIRFKGEGYRMSVVFYGCDKNNNDNCDSVQLRVAFDRPQPWRADAAMEIARKYRYASIWLDDEGDPIITWDIVTGDGIPRTIFLSNVRRFEDTVDNAAALVFAK